MGEHMLLAQIESEAFSLPTDQRAQLVRRLILSLDEVSEEEFDGYWGNESAKRAAAFDVGDVKMVAGEEVAGKARDLLR